MDITKIQNKYATNKPKPTTITTPEKSTPIGAIVGGAVGGVVAVALVALLIIWRKKKGGDKPTANPAAPPNPPNPAQAPLMGHDQSAASPYPHDPRYSVYSHPGSPQPPHNPYYAPPVPQGGYPYAHGSPQYYPPHAGAVEAPATEVQHPQQGFYAEPKEAPVATAAPVEPAQLPTELPASNR